MQKLLRKGFVGATFHEAVTKPPARKTLAITFDDAYLSVLELAQPILEGLGLPATVFVPTDFPDAPGQAMKWQGIDGWLGGEYDSELRPMSWQQLGGLADRGWEIGSHTRSHPHLTQLDQLDLEAELTGSREVCEQRLGRPCRTIAYPYGDYDARVAAAAGAAGYEAAAALPSRLTPQRSLEWPRVGIYHEDDDRRFALKVSRPMRRLRGSVLWPRA
ncbi:MAG TPA: polysaccharide deacetylase family protein [Solirubrobacterales bacterium]